MMANCPWSFLTPQHYNFCETQVCGWVNQPANTISNLGYLIVGLWILKTKDSEKVLRLFFSFSLFALFLASTIFHGTGSHLGKMLDVSAMFVISMGILTISLNRYFGWSRKKQGLFFGSGLMASLVFLFTFKFGHVLFLTEIAFATLFEILAHSAGKHSLDRQQFSYSLVSLGIGMGVWWLDAQKILCWPDQHYFSGHGLWHILTALSIGFLFRSYQFKLKTGTEVPVIIS